MDYQLQELFSVPIGLKPAANIDGVKLFSSDNLKKSFMQAFEKSGRGKPIADDMQVLIDKGLVTPCYLSKGIIRFFLHKTFGGADKTVLGFYHRKIQKVYVLIDNNISVFGVGSSDLVVATTMHECMHLLAGLKPSQFLSIFKVLLIKYYTAALSMIFDIDNIDQNSVKKIYRFLIKYENASDNNINKDLGDYYRLLEKELLSQTKMDEQKFKKILTDYIVILKLLLSNFNVFVRVARKYLHIITPLEKSYQVAFGERNTYTTSIQELIYPSEIACVYSEMKPTSSYIKKAFRALS
jgi:hypothetical protein